MSMVVKKAGTLGEIAKVVTVDALQHDEELDQFYYGHTMAIRLGDPVDSPLEDLFDNCSDISVKNAHLLLGHRGCGKSTELRKLKQRFEATGQPVEFIDITLDIDLLNASCWDVMILITEGLCNIAHRENVSISRETLTAVFEYLTTDVEITEEVKKSVTDTRSVSAEVSTPFSLMAILNFFAAFKKEVHRNKNTRTTMTTKMEKRASDWVDYIKQIYVTIAAQLKDKQPILIFDNIDKIQPVETVLEIFSYAILAEMPFPIIYTFPISLSYNSRYVSIKSFYKTHTLPMIKIKDIDKNEISDGIEVIKKIVDLRVDLSLFNTNVLDVLIKQTGGVLRDLFKCIEHAAIRASRREATKIEREDAERALSVLSIDLSKLISLPDYPKLINIYENKKDRMQIVDTGFLLEKMNALVILEYQNGYHWHDLHPLVERLLKNQGAIWDSNG